MFQIAVHAFDYSSIGGNDDLGVTSYTYRDNRPTVQTVTTNPGNKNMRYTRVKHVKEWRKTIGIKLYLFSVHERNV